MPGFISYMRAPANWCELVNAWCRLMIKQSAGCCSMIRRAPTGVLWGWTGASGEGKKKESCKNRPIMVGARAMSDDACPGYNQQRVFLVKISQAPPNYNSTLKAGDA